MKRTDAKREQFSWAGNDLIHKPTGARFSPSYPNSASESHSINWGHAGDRLPSGEDYDREDVYRVARELLVERLRANRAT